MTDSERSGKRADLRLYKPKEAEKITGLTAHWLVQQAREGKIPHRRYGARIVRFSVEDLEEIKQLGARTVEDDPARSA